MWPLSRQTKEALAYVLGASGFLHELILYQGERPFLLTASLALMGFPLVFKAEEKRKNGKANGENSPENKDSE